MRGRKPKPTAHQIAQGDPRKHGKNKLAEKLAAEPQAQRGFPVCPTHIQGLARRTWKFLVEQIAHMNMDRRPDALMLEGACVNYARAVEADAAIAEKGLTIKQVAIIGEKGSEETVVLNEKARPEVAISKACWVAAKAFLSEFGLSPVGLTRLHVTGQEKEDDLATMLSAPREPRPVTVQ
jgi:P27 family predicted phage terminase small subunit